VKALFLVLVLCIASSSHGEESKHTIPPTSGNEKIKQPCPLCKLPGRAHLFAGTVSRCPPTCAKPCCKGRSVVFVVEESIDSQGAGRITTALSVLEGVQPQNTSPDSCNVRIRYAPEKITKGKLREVIQRCGFRVTGEQETFTIEGLNTRALADKVEAAIRKEPGITSIETVCPVNQKAIVVFDPLKTNSRKIADAINSTPCRVVHR
tara:strand:- start:1825 stop:2445 length:621 start_codon:yes stop_codon:yes gene_type:complete